MKKAAAFSFVELLVVISLISLLLSILIPSLNRSKEIARSIVCRHLLKNYGMVLIYYLNENDDMLPISVNDPVMRPWHTLDYFREQVALPPLDNEYKRRRLEIQEYKPGYPKGFVCPSAKYALRNSEEGLFSMCRSYGINAGSYYAKVINPDENYKFNFRNNRSIKLCMADSLDWWISMNNCEKYSLYGEDWLGFETYGMSAYRHSGRMNSIFWDGRAEKLQPQRVAGNTSLWLANP